MKSLFLPAVAVCAAMSLVASAAASSDCSPAYRNGLHGTFRIAWNVACDAPAQPTTAENSGSCPQRWSQELKEDLTAQAANGPVYFTWVSGDRQDPAAIQIVVRFREENGRHEGATNHWGEVWVMEIPKAGKKGVTLFHFNTNSYQGDDTNHSVLVEASSTAYSKFVNGWACGSNDW